MTPCIKCNSTENGYYTAKSRTCRKCTNLVTVENKNRRARLEGYRNYYQKLKLKEYETKKEAIY